MVKSFTTAAATIALTLGLGLGSVMAQTTAPATTPAAATTTVQDFGIGQMDAKVVIDEYASFTCPHCARFHEDVYPQLKADYIDTGKVRLVYHEVYFDRYGLWAAMMARCGGEMRYIGIVDTLYSTQKDWAASDKPAEVVDNLKKIGRAAGMDDASLDACMKDNTTAQTLIDHYETSFKAAGIEGTPTFLINGVKHTNMAYPDLKALIDAELAK
ncbi:MAG: DsbA family protein [Cypionkella sp.]